MPRLTVAVLAAPEHPLPYNLSALESIADFRVTDAAGLRDALDGAQGLLLWDFFSSALRDAWTGASSLEWVHVAAAGVDAILFDELRASDVVLTNAHGIFDRPIAEYVLAAILAFDKELHHSRVLQDRREWHHRDTRRTYGSTALIVGAGGIGREIARVLRPLGIEVRGVGRTARESDPDFGTVVPSSDLALHVGWADHVVAVAPLTGSTRGMFDAGVFGAMKDSAHFVNVGRGALVDEASLVSSLENGGLAGASLDVVAVEPLPLESPLWAMPQVQISAHLSGDVTGWRDDLADQFKDNLERWAAGRGFEHVVDKELGFVRRA
ncbi:D-2-hydroxyacid dehydrogenase [Arthrobacter sp. H5]|uniref:D-2-hydroxyacid dehydrogenase n=1 Tax=Arthrobacter sp. H5 TaxID=1267973 RepID=UPI0004877CC8|nr:D-2-hydroxyacid dehydrogenase [Arthrobacter sp. H5]